MCFKASFCMPMVTLYMKTGVSEVKPWSITASETHTTHLSTALHKHTSVLSSMMRSLRLDEQKDPLILSSIHNRGVIPLILLGLSSENLQLWFADKQ